MSNYKTDNLTEAKQRQYELTPSNIQEDEVRKDFVFLSKKEFLLDPLYLHIADVKKIEKAVLKIEEKEKQNILEKITKTPNLEPLILRINNIKNPVINIRELQEKELANACPEMVRHFFKQKKGGETNE